MGFSLEMSPLMSQEVCVHLSKKITPAKFNLNKWFNNAIFVKVSDFRTKIEPKLVLNLRCVTFKALYFGNVIR